VRDVLTEPSLESLRIRGVGDTGLQEPKFSAPGLLFASVAKLSSDFDPKPLLTASTRGSDPTPNGRA